MEYNKMKKFLTLILASFIITAKSQIVLEHKYDSTSDYKNNELLIVKFELLGEQFVRINRQGKSISIYDLNHSLTKTISLSSFPQSPNGLFMILYLSQQLFDMDAAIEFLYGYVDNNNVPHTRIYKENGAAIFIADSLYSWDEFSIPQQQYTIYNTSQGTKMILSHYTSGQSYVYSLPGNLTAAVEKSNEQLMQERISSPTPNPTAGTVKVKYRLPSGSSQGEIIFYDLQGSEMKRFKVDGAFEDLLISTTDMPAGTYYYQLTTAGMAWGNKKMVVLK